MYHALKLVGKGGGDLTPTTSEPRALWPEQPVWVAEERKAIFKGVFSGWIRDLDHNDLARCDTSIQKPGGAE